MSTQDEQNELDGFPLGSYIGTGVHLDARVFYPACIYEVPGRNPTTAELAKAKRVADAFAAKAMEVSCKCATFTVEGFEEFSVDMTEWNDDLDDFDWFLTLMDEHNVIIED